MIRMSSWFTAVGIMASVGLSSSAYAQAQQTGSLIGAVTDTSGGALPGVAVNLTSESLIRAESAVTDEKGGYRFTLLPIGTYDLSFSLAGFTTVVRKQIPVSADKTLTVNATMQVAAVAETINVSGAAPVVDVKSATQSVNIDRRAIEGLPTSRDIWSILQNQAPQVVQNREDVGGP